MTEQKKKIKKEMVEQFLHWAKYNPTLVQKEFGCNIEALKIIMNKITFKM